MRAQFAEIHNLSQLDYLRDEPEFIFKEEGDTTIVFYAVAFPHTFDSGVNYGRH